MIEINDTQYKLCCLDTNILSNLVQKPEIYLYKFMTLFPPSNHIPCFTPFSLYELRPVKKIFDQFLSFFSDFYSCILLKHPNELILEELKNYPNSNLVDPIALGFSPLDSPSKGSFKELVNLTFTLPNVIQKEKNWPNEKKKIMQEIIQLKSNFQKDKYNSSTVTSFAKKVIRQQIKARRDWNPNLGNPNFNAFPSYKMELYTVFHRFYIHQHRKPELGDIFDFMISSVTPYVDIVILENFQADITEQIKKEDSFIEHVEIYRLKDIKTQ